MPRPTTAKALRVRSVGDGQCVRAVLPLASLGRCIGLKVDNCPDWPVLFWAVLMSGHRPLLLDFRLNGAQTMHLVQGADAIALCTSGTTSTSRVYEYSGTAVSRHMLGLGATDWDNPRTGLPALRGFSRRGRVQRNTADEPPSSSFRRLDVARGTLGGCPKCCDWL